ncbi:hypothetical protein HPB50_022149 [Hyalomma asiaticum]|uniref:Uncharacterized protein n=1 Tax=Hyalomma asiaticum TaxID=266040 RepID=A0ACB7TB14_HYAAI|nr:hypothetical protein HPB50_022149 [Hyalomma asiaticum]
MALIQDQGLIDLKPATSATNVRELRRFFDDLRGHMRGLKALGIGEDSYNTMPAAANTSRGDGPELLSIAGGRFGFLIDGRQFISRISDCTSDSVHHLAALLPAGVGKPRKGS